jgi:hypothetical protein
VTDERSAGAAYCPSAAPDVPGATILGVTSRTESGPRVIYLAEPVLLTEEIAASLDGVSDGEVLRIAAPCQEGACPHFRDSDCSLITKIVRAGPDASDAADAHSLPQCYLRPRCRWFRQEKAAACRRCPTIATEVPDSTDLQLWVADPANSAAEFDPREFLSTP